MLKSRNSTPMFYDLTNDYIQDEILEAIHELTRSIDALGAIMIGHIMRGQP